MSNDLADDLRRAVDEDEIAPYFQPLVDLRTGRLVEFEVLARWHHPVRGIVHPSTFIPLAEATGLIGPLTERLLPRACRAASSWPAHVTLSVNLSPVQLQDRALAERLSAAVEPTGFPFHRLVFEITEEVLIGNLDQARDIARELKALGARLALDDFGIGYANLCQLRALPFDRLKVDRSFVATMAAQRAYRQIVASMIGLGHSLGLCTVAEGVETRAEAEMLTSLGCDLGQGWLFGRPVPADQVPQVLARQAAHDGADQPIADDMAHRLETMPHHCLSQLRALYRDAPVGLGLLDSGRRYMALNKRLADMHGAPVMAHLGRTGAEILPPGLYSQVEPLLRRALDGHAVTDFETRWRGPNGGDQDQILHVSYQPVRDAADDVIGVSIAVLDWTERDGVRRGACLTEPEIGTAEVQAALSPRQRDVLRLLAAGRSVKEIARELGLSAGTVKTHLAKIYRVLGVRNRVEAVVAAGRSVPARRTP